MNIEDFQNITPDNAGDLISRIAKREKKIKYKDKELTIADCLKQYNPNTHEIFDEAITGKRPNKILSVPMPGQEQEEKPAMMSKTVYVNRSPNPAQRLIVGRANAFLTGNPIELVYSTEIQKEKDLQAVIQRIWDNNKLDYKSNTIGKKMMSETHVAEIWYVVPMGTDTNDYEGLNIDTKNLTIRVKIVAKSLGDDLFPIFDRMGDMIAFVRMYQEITENSETIKHTEIYTATKTVLIENRDDVFKVDTKAQTLGKIPVVYYSQDQPEWLDVQANIERSELLLSNFGDTNDYYSSPTTVVKGKVEGFSQKGETGKIIEVDENADVSLMEWSNSTEAVQAEKAMQKEIILEGTQTPDISFESMKGLGTFSGIALKMLFFDASLKVKDKAEVYGECIQRRINLLKAAVAKWDISFEAVRFIPIKPKIEVYMPENLEERINLLSTATNSGKILSTETAVSLNPYVSDKEAEIKRLKEEADNDLDLRV